jgi:N-acetylneuraminate synthase
MDEPYLEIEGRRIGPGDPVYIVAEISANHGGDFERAARLVRAAANAGADAVQVQTYTPDTLTIDCSSECFCIGGEGPWAGRTLYDLYAEAHMPWEWQPELKQFADEIGIHFLSTPFDAQAVAFLSAMQVPAFKIASFELVDTGLLRAVAETGRPVIASTGMATPDEIGEAVAMLCGAGADQVALLKCTSAYPAPADEMNLRAIPRLAEQFDVVAGLSDHSRGDAAAVASVALGACIIEKHFTLSRVDGGPDAAFSVQPEEFAAMVQAIRTVERALGTATLEPTSGEQERRAFRRSLFVVRDIAAGEVFTAQHVRSIRPGHGLPPRELDKILGKRAAADVVRGTPLRWDLVE